MASIAILLVGLFLVALVEAEVIRLREFNQELEKAPASLPYAAHWGEY